MDIKRALKNANETGTLTIGLKETMKELKKGKVKLIIVASNCPEEDVKALKAYKVPLYRFPDNNVDLGASTGKPFSISTMGVVNAGKSDILALKGEQ
jgi:large subunit ribosomal protein L30e